MEEKCFKFGSQQRLRGELERVCPDRVQRNHHRQKGKMLRHAQVQHAQQSVSKEVRVFPLLFLQHGFCQLIDCTVSVGIWCALLVLELCSTTSSCALSVLGVVSRTVDWRTNRGATTFQRPELSGPSCSVCLRSRSVLGAQEQQRCCSRVISMVGVCGISNLVRISREPRCTRALRARSSDFLLHVLSRNDRRIFWRGIRRSRTGEFLPLGISIRNSQCVSCRPGSLPRCGCRTPFHRFRSTWFSHRVCRRIGRTAEARLREFPTRSSGPLPSTKLFSWSFLSNSGAA